MSKLLNFTNHFTSTYYSSQHLIRLRLVTNPVGVEAGTYRRTVESVGEVQEYQVNKLKARVRVTHESRERLGCDLF